MLTVHSDSGGATLTAMNARSRARSGGGGEAGAVRPASGTFESEAHAVLTRLQTAVGALLVKDRKRITRAKDLQVALGVRGPLAWQVFRWATAEGPLATVMFIPKPEAMARVLEAAADAAYRPPMVRELERAYAEFAAFAESHAEDRASLDAMIAALGPVGGGGATPGLSMTHRRAAYRANTQIWGLSARAMYAACIYHARGEDESAGYGSIMVKGFVGLHTLRPFTSIPLSKRYMEVEHGGVVNTAVTEFMIFEDFCSDMGEGVRSVREANEIHDTLRIRGVGSSSKTTVFVGVSVNELPMADPTDRTVAVGCSVQVPCEEIILDLLVPEDRSAKTTPNVTTLGVINDPLSGSARRDDPDCRLPGAHAGQYLGNTIESLRCDEIPSCPELIRAAIRRTGWTDPRYNIYRVRIPYPVLHSHAGLESMLI